jgi:hypothetical protein
MEGAVEVAKIIECILARIRIYNYIQNGKADILCNYEVKKSVLDERN